jgi:hypothetical protein
MAPSVSPGHTAWQTSGEGDNLIVYLPQNLETLGDNPLSRAAFAACKVLRPQYMLADNDQSDMEYDKKVQLYLNGVAWALNVNDANALHPYQDVSGAMGHGFYWICHRALETKTKAGAWWAKGTPWHLTKGLTGKAWSSDLDATTKSVNSLLSRAAAMLDINPTWHTWFRPRDSFLGRELKKALPHKKVGILQEEESARLGRRFKLVVSEYENLLKDLLVPTIGMLPNLATRMRDVGKSLTPLASLVDSIISFRAGLIYPSNKKANKIAKKRPIRELIRELPFDKYVLSMDPTQLEGYKPFQIADLEDEPTEAQLQKWSDAFNKRISALETKLRDDPYLDFIRDWANIFSSNYVR